MAVMEIDFFKFDPECAEEVVHVYHGTRVTPQTIRDNGLVYPGNECLIKMIEKSLTEAGLSYPKWLDHQRKLISKGKLNTFRELDGKYRRNIWVTDDLNNAWSYARRAPEIVSEAIHNEYIRLHCRRKYVIEEANLAVKAGIEWIGKPVVVVLDAKQLGAKRGCNQPIAPVIPKEAVIEIKTMRNINE
jgi:hypothetical protein